MKFPKSFDDLVESFSKYPGIGKKTAQRLAFFTMDNLDEAEVTTFSQALNDVKKNLHKCHICGNITEGETCQICEDLERDKNTIMVVETIKDVYAIENIGNFHGLYHVLNGVIDFSKGIGPDEINIESLLKRLNDSTELILATSGTVEGELTAKYIKSIISPSVEATRLAYGLPVGSNFEYLDELTLQRAIEGRKKFE